MSNGSGVGQPPSGTGSVSPPVVQRGHLDNALKIAAVAEALDRVNNLRGDPDNEEKYTAHFALIEQLYYKAAQEIRDGLGL